MTNYDKYKNYITTRNIKEQPVLQLMTALTGKEKGKKILRSCESVISCNTDCYFYGECINNFLSWLAEPEEEVEIIKKYTESELDFLTLCKDKYIIINQYSDSIFVYSDEPYYADGEWACCSPRAMVVSRYGTNIKLKELKYNTVYKVSDLLNDYYEVLEDLLY